MGDLKVINSDEGRKTVLLNVSGFTWGGEVSLLFISKAY